MDGRRSFFCSDKLSQGLIKTGPSSDIYAQVVYGISRPHQCLLPTLMLHILVACPFDFGTLEDMLKTDLLQTQIFLRIGPRAVDLKKFA